jgi:erythronate-4-phosphate dehydrogenase
MKIVCASSVLLGAEAFGTLGDTVVIPDGDITREDLREADALIVRSKTRVNRALLDGTSVKFVGTATAGVDHLDLGYLAGAEIACADAGGSNANSVAEYGVAALLHLVETHGLLIEDLTLGIVGVGHVGSAVCDKAIAMGMKVLQNDPPRAAREGDPALIPLPDLLAESDIVTLHVPLVDDGPWPTRRLADCRFLRQLPPGALLINASRGEVLDSHALLAALESGQVLGAALDVWEDEPAVPTALLERVDLGTAHIAGYSYEGKLNGTLYVYHHLCRFLEVEPMFDPQPFAPRSTAPPLRLDIRGRLTQDILREAVRAAYDIQYDDAQLRAGASTGPDPERGAYFNRLRREYRCRREFPATLILAQGLPSHMTHMLLRLGFGIGEGR